MKPAQIGLYRPAQFLPDVSHCGCPLSEGCWGSCGWHFFRATQQSMYRLEQHRFAKDRPGWDQVELRKAWLDWVEAETREGRMDKGGMHETWKPYIGLPFAYEPCTAYMAGVQKKQDQEKAKKAAEKKRGKLYGE